MAAKSGEGVVMCWRRMELRVSTAATRSALTRFAVKLAFHCAEGTVLLLARLARRKLGRQTLLDV